MRAEDLVEGGCYEFEDGIFRTIKNITWPWLTFTVNNEPHGMTYHAFLSKAQRRVPRTI